MRDAKNPNGPERAKPELRNLQANGSWLGPSLLVKGEISGAEDLLIDGSVEGVVRRRLENAQVFIESGARFKGTLEIDKSTEKATDENALYEAKSAAAKVAAAATAGARNA